MEDTVDMFLNVVSAHAPIGCMAIDRDRYQAAVATLRALNGPAEKYLPTVRVYLVDITQYESNQWCEFAAVQEFNAKNDLRKIDDDRTLYVRPIPNAKWHKNVYHAMCRSSIQEKFRIKTKGENFTDSFSSQFHPYSRCFSTV